MINKCNERKTTQIFNHSESEINLYYLTFCVCVCAFCQTDEIECMCGMCTSGFIPLDHSHAKRIPWVWFELFSVVVFSRSRSLSSSRNACVNFSNGRVCFRTLYFEWLIHFERQLIEFMKWKLIDVVIVPFLSCKLRLNKVIAIKTTPIPYYLHENWSNSHAITSNWGL